MSAPHLILDCLPSLSQKLSQLVESWQSYDKNNFDCFFSVTRCSNTLHKCWNEWKTSSKLYITVWQLIISTFDPITKSNYCSSSMTVCTHRALSVSQWSRSQGNCCSLKQLGVRCLNVWNLHRHWNLKLIFTQKWASVELGVEPP